MGKPSFDETTQKNLDSWLSGNYDEKTKQSIRNNLEKNPEAIVDAFYTNLSFGTGGLRGVMGPGTNRMNEYTVSFATQGLANYINKKAKKNVKPKVLIGHDSRNRSHEFAEEAAKVLAANNIEVYLYKELRPVPMVSYGLRHLNCTAGIMITASHNPPEYNGYKVYWEDGAQVLPPHDEGIIEEVNKVNDVSQVSKLKDLHNSLIHFIDDEIDKAYLNDTKKYQLSPQTNKEKGKNLNVIYTPIHGSGITMVPKALKDWGFTNLQIVSEQEKPDGNFPTVVKPNPEEKEALKIGIQHLLDKKADILIGTDPDCDRIGVVSYHKCQAALLNGNETACICLYYICKKLSEDNKFPEKAAFVKTIVTSELFKTIAESYNKPCFNVLTGFKYIGQLIHQWEDLGQDPHDFIFGGEESYGYLIGTHARDKDAIIMSALVAEVALWAKEQKKTLIDILEDIYKEYGVFREKLTSINFKEGKAGKDQMQKMMTSLRKSPPKSFADQKTKTIEDYSLNIRKNLESGKEEPINLPISNVLLFWLEDQSKLVIRPSGTEPKIKIYCGVKKQIEGSIEETIASCDKQIDELIKDLQKLLPT